MNPRLQAENEAARFRHAQRIAAQRAHETQFAILLAKSEAFFNKTPKPTPLPAVGRVVWDRPTKTL